MTPTIWNKEADNLDEAIKTITASPEIQNLLKIFEENNAGKAEFVSLLSHIGAVERQLDEATREVTAMRRELAALRDEQRHPFRTALNRAITRLENGISAARAQLSEIKSTISERAAQAAAAFKEKGISAINKTMDFLGMKEKLSGLQEYLNKEVQAADKSIAKIEAVSAEYHETGKHLRNIGRALRGKEAIQDTKPMGFVAKAVRAPYKGARAALSGASRSAGAAIGKLEQLEKAARPSALEAMRKQQQVQERRAVGMALSRSRAAEESL